jgi:hypothetical protein
MSTSSSQYRVTTSAVMRCLRKFSTHVRHWAASLVVPPPLWPRTNLPDFLCFFEPGRESRGTRFVSATAGVPGDCGRSGVIFTPGYFCRRSSVAR